ncbi:MAG: hypothetical protein LBD07_03210, partial [Spirochaetaceae bacterium]|nr:hypothetical protein [Spirochaetaceae bacterium]
MKGNHHDQAIPEELIKETEKTLELQMEAFQPYFSTLTPEERQSMLKLGAKTFLFVEKACALAVENPNLTSKAFDANELVIDFGDAHRLIGLLNKARQFVELLEDITMTSGSEAHYAALEFYADVKAAAARNVPEAHAVYAELKAVYPSRKKKRKGEEEESFSSEWAQE